MRVLYFSQDYTPHDHRFLASLSRTEHEVHYLRLEDRKKGQETRQIPEGVECVAWKDGRGRMRGMDWPQALLLLRRRLRELRPDLVHAGPVQRPAFLTALSGFRPLVTMSWGSDLIVGARRGLGKWIASFALSRSAAFIADSQVVLDFGRRLGMPQERTFVFPWGVDLAHFTPQMDDSLRSRLGWEQAFILLSTRAWEPNYGIEPLLEGFLLAAKGMPDLRLLMLGGGSMRGYLESRLDRAGMRDRVHFPGQVGFEALPAYYRAADLYVTASRSDGTSISLLESMACGLPAIVSDIPGNREWVQPGKNGWWFRDGNAQAFANAIGLARKASSKLPSMSREARKVAEERADWRQNFQTLLQAYRCAVDYQKAVM